MQDSNKYHREHIKNDPPLPPRRVVLIPVDDAPLVIQNAILIHTQTKQKITHAKDTETSRPAEHDMVTGHSA
jgi:flagellar biogenesis protein FliO